MTEQNIPTNAVVSLNGKEYFLVVAFTSEESLKTTDPSYRETLIGKRVVVREPSEGFSLTVGAQVESVPLFSGDLLQILLDNLDAVEQGTHFRIVRE